MMPHDDVSNRNDQYIRWKYAIFIAEEVQML